eukprot:m.245675 g.245675  ORF g.245675 m.245675 type:complete len:534 (+) comp33838_c1_seq10:214-1815(+)
MPPVNATPTVDASDGPDSKQIKYDYDYVVIGGGSGGMASAKEAASLGAKVALFDFVKPSTQGTKWGLGGTCVNVGCVPKKLMHYAGLIGEALHDAHSSGWNIPADTEKPQPVEFDWMGLMGNTRSHVKSLNFAYKGGLRSANVEYINAHAEFESQHTISYTVRNKPTATLTAKYILIATGGRPVIPDDVPGAKEHAITSDDIFYLKKSPGKTLCVGGGYIALECAGFLRELGFDTSVAVRSILLRGFDRDCAEKIGEIMKAKGTTFLEKTLPSKIVKGEDGKLTVTFKSTTGVETEDVFDTVLYATGRYADTQLLKLDKAGVQTDKKGKFECVDEQTNVPHIYAVGDVLAGRLELTPVAIKAGELLARRLFSQSNKTMDYDLVPTAVFTPSEYGCVGYSEEAAIEKFGADALETYLWQWSTLEHQAAHRLKAVNVRANIVDTMPPNCLAKLVCLKSEKERVVGFHFVGPNAGEVTQGFALAVRCGATKDMFDDMVGIHPTDAEAFCTMTVKRKDVKEVADWTASGGCGGGKCG